MNLTMGVEGIDIEKRECLLKLICELSFMEGDFTLASGRHARFYIDGKRVLFHPQGLLLVVDAFMQAAQGVDYDAVGGLEMGAVPIAVGISMRSAETDKPIPAFFVRKSAKEHGTRRFTEGCLDGGSRVLICDDVVTSGKSVLKAIEKIEEQGCTVARIVSLVDRGEGGIETFAERGYDYHLIFTLDEITEYARTRGNRSSPHR